MLLSMNLISAELELSAAMLAFGQHAKTHCIPPELAWHVHREEVIDESVNGLVTKIHEHGMSITTPWATRF